MRAHAVRATRRALRCALPLILIGTSVESLCAQPPTPRPLDPLTREEVAAADRVLRGQPALVPVLTRPRTLLTLAELLTAKGEQARDSDSAGVVRGATRIAELYYYAYQGDEGVRALVDVGAQRVLGTERLAGAQVPMAAAEIAEARAIALRDTGVVRAVGVLGVAPDRLSVRWIVARNRTDPDGCAARRCLQLFFTGPDGGTLSDPQVFVDLTNRRAIVRGRTR